MGQAYPIELAKLRGRNGWDSPVDLPDGVCAEMRNMHLYNGAMGEKRAGSTAQTLTGDAHTGYNALFRFQPGQDDTLAELFIFSVDATPKILRVAGGTVKVNLTLSEGIQSRPWDVSGAILNGKLYLAYDSSVNRLHVFDPGLSVTTIRKAGVGTPAAPTVANHGVGTYPATLRYYKVAYTEDRGGVTVRHSELSPSVSFTPSGAGTDAAVTKPAAIGEGETHWELYASPDGVLFYLVSKTDVGTTTIFDTTAVSDYANFEAEAPAGTYTNWPSVKYLATDGNRLLGYGVWEATAGDAMTPKPGRVYFSPVLDTTGTHDDEHSRNTVEGPAWIDITRNSSSIDRGITPEPINNTFLVFQDRGITMLVPTEAADLPYRRIKLTSSLGAVTHQSIVMGEDEVGRPCVYFLDPNLGPYRYGTGGFQRIGKDVQDIWDTVNTAATGQPAWGLYYKPLNLVLFFVATGVSNDPDTILAFDITEGQLTDQDGIRNGWFVWDGDFAHARCGVMFSTTMGASMSRKLVPYVGMTTGTKLLRYDVTVTQDDTTSFRAYLISRAFTGKDLPRNKQTLHSYLLATTEPGVTIEQAWVRNFGDETNRTDTVVLTASGAESRTLQKFSSPELAEAHTFQVQLGDSAAAATAWTLERWWADVEEQALR